ncbi:hypothetical protein PENSPDRAFT_695443 [Peniophora sp. CONT]|nr:hypothetical protein PENSPDRAFT_695443 [Peniophora sp. CONT]
MSSGLAQPTLPSDEDFAQSDAEDRWKQALESYRLETGHDLLKYSFAQDILATSSVDNVMGRLKLFMAYRARGHKILSVLKPIVSVVIRFIDAGAEGAANVAPGGKAIFVAFGVLLQVDVTPRSHPTPVSC